MKITSLSAILATAFAGLTQAATVVQYHDGTTSTAAFNVATGITASVITYQGLVAGDTGFRTSFGTAGPTPAGPTSGTAAGSNWKVWRKGSITGALNATAAYAGFTATIGAAADGITFGNLSVDLAGGAANSVTGGIDVNYQVFAQVNGGGFNAIGSPSGFIELIPNATTNTFSSVLTGSSDLSSLGALSTGDIIDIRIAVRSEDNVGATNIGLFMQGIKLDDAIPEPSSALLAASALVVGLLRRRR